MSPDSARKAAVTVVKPTSTVDPVDAAAHAADTGAPKEAADAEKKEEEDP